MKSLFYQFAFCRCLLLLFSLLCLKSSLFAQFNIQLEGQDQFPSGITGLTPVVDKLDRDYVYVAANEDGLKIYDVVMATPVLVQSLDTIALGARVMSVTQRDTLLYVCIGTHFGTGQSDPPGITIVDVADPLSPIVLDSWTGNPAHGTGIVRVLGDYAYVGGMYEGLIVLNISDPNNISFVSQLIPPIDFPHPNNTQEKVNARGMDVVDSLVYLCYDQGGVRVINCADINNPVEIEMWANPVTFDPMEWPRAYNNIIVDDTVAYVAVDYCGLEILDIRDPYNISMITHYNPHDCPVNGLWWGAPIHTNEMVLQKECNALFISTGKSDLLVMDIADPYAPIAIDSFGTVLDTAATWGIDMNDEHIYLTYTYIPTWVPSILVPFYSEWNGVKKLAYDKCGLGQINMSNESSIVYPNPSSGILNVSSDAPYRYRLIDLSGKLTMRGNGASNNQIDLSLVEKGTYILTLEYAEQVVRHKIVLE